MENESKPEKEISHEELFGAGHPALKRRVEADQYGSDETRSGSDADQIERRTMIPGEHYADIRMHADDADMRIGEPSRSAKIFDTIFRWVLYLAVFLTPPFFFSSSDPRGFAKGWLISVLALVILASWAGKVISEGKIAWRKSWLVWPALAVGLAVILSNIFSSSFWVSFLGDNGRYDFSTVSILSYLVIFLAILFNARNREAMRLVWIMLVSAGLIAVTSLLQFAGAFLFPADFTKDRFFSLVGSPFALAFFAGFALPVIVGLLSAVERRALKVALFVLGALDLLILLLVDFRAAWLALAVSLLVYVLVSSLRQRFLPGAWSSQRRLTLPLVIFIVALVFGLFPNFPGIQLDNVPSEVSPSYSASFKIIQGSWSDNFILGAGPETFPYEYGKYKSADLNQTEFWGVNFNNANAEILTWASNQGLLGILAWLSFAIGFLIIALRKIRGEKPPLVFGLLAAWVFILASKFFYSSAVPIELLFWVLPALLVALIGENDSQFGLRSYEFRAGSAKTLILFAVSLVVLVASVGGLYLSVQRFLAEKNYVTATALAANAENRDEQVESLRKAVSLNSRVPTYQQSFGQALVTKAGDILNSLAAKSIEEQRSAASEAAQIQNLTAQAFSALSEARRLDPENVALLINVAETYKLTSSYVAGANDVAIEIYEQAVRLEPVNPFLKTQLAQLYLAKENFFLNQQIRGGELVERAKGYLSEAVVLNPIYSNARYFLGFILDREGDRAAALEQFERVLEFNQDNQAIQLIVRNLRSGLPALGPPPPPSPQEAPVPAGEAQGR